MLLTLTLTANPAVTNATELGYLLHKHPDRVRSVDIPGARATVFYPEASPTRCTAALLLEPDPEFFVRDSYQEAMRYLPKILPESPAHVSYSGYAESGVGGLYRYVNDRPYCAASMLAVALAHLLGTALAGRCDARPELARAELPLEIRVATVRTDPALARRFFEPLGWGVELETVPLAEGLDWGQAPYVNLTLTGRARLTDALFHLYLLLPALDGLKHYWSDYEEKSKLLKYGGTWLVSHPERDLITRRYLISPLLAREAIAQLEDLESIAPTVIDIDKTHGEVADTQKRTLRAERLDAVLAALHEVGAHRRERRVRPAGALPVGRGLPGQSYGRVRAHPHPVLEWVNNTLCLDTGCTFGGKLSALRGTPDRAGSRP